ncbi:hypothetical protein ebA795 [Aromatoleum aromaticum EbN1]|uniref:Uncharacterized protein n=1 Tax=Aromatoleum aromaticum (strain DSM 19018 / LMG 30748 / EbN1) TaxID=76114 RepID=Q5P825_AROAE|nr:hypothetical protein ebA795 [Aromatoleum aromaticum EbN1]
MSCSTRSSGADAKNPLSTGFLIDRDRSVCPPLAPMRSGTVVGTKRKIAPLHNPLRNRQSLGSVVASYQPAAVRGGLGELIRCQGAAHDKIPPSLRKALAGLLEALAIFEDDGARPSACPMASSFFACRTTGSGGSARLAPGGGDFVSNRRGEPYAGWEARDRTRAPSPPPGIE